MFLVSVRRRRTSQDESYSYSPTPSYEADSNAVATLRYSGDASDAVDADT